MDQLEKDKEALAKARQELDWAQDEVNRLERAVEYGRCKRCNDPLNHGEGKEFCSDYPNCESPRKEPTLNERAEKFGELLKDNPLSQEDIEKYFPPDNTPKGWVSIEDHLPAVTVDDFLNNDAIVRIVLVKDKNGNEFRTQVGDHNVWYYIAREAGVTHWWNGELTKKQEVLCALSEARNITPELLQNLLEEHNVQFDIVSIPIFPVPPTNNDKIRLFKFNDKLFL